jgi:hypothetical protein
MTNKTLFCSFIADFCIFFASLRPRRTVFTRQKTSIISVNPVILSNFSSCLCVLRGKKIPEISVNPRLLKDLRSTKDYVRKNNLFMQNEPNFKKVKYDVNNVLTKDYDQMDTWSIRKTKPIKANKSQFKPIKANLSQYYAKTKPIQTQTNPKH